MQLAACNLQLAACSLPPAGIARDTYSETGVNSIADRINQTKHTMQRGVNAGAESFMRPS